MASQRDQILKQVYAARNAAEQRDAYDNWASDYDADLFRYHSRLHIVAATVFTRFVEVGAGPFLDAGCGTGLQTEPLALVGYGPFTGIDLSEGMLAVARDKGIYADLRQMMLGEALDFADDQFAASYCTGTLTPGHAPPSTFDELIRVTAPGGLVIFSLRLDRSEGEAEQQQGYVDAVASHVERGAWRALYQTPMFASIPGGDPNVRQRILVYRVAA